MFGKWNWNEEERTAVKFHLEAIGEAESGEDSAVHWQALVEIAGNDREKAREISELKIVSAVECISRARERAGLSPKKYAIMVREPEPKEG